MIRRSRVQPPMGRPYVLVEAVPDGMHLDEMPPPPPSPRSPEADVDRVLSYVARQGGRVQATRLSASFARMGGDRLRAAVDALVARGLLARETEPKGSRPGWPRTWITLAPAKAPVSPVAASVEPEACGATDSTEAPHGGNGVALDTVAAPFAEEVES